MELAFPSSLITDLDSHSICIFGTVHATKQSQYLTNSHHDPIKNRQVSPQVSKQQNNGRIGDTRIKRHSKKLLRKIKIDWREPVVMETDSVQSNPNGPPQPPATIVPASGRALQDSLPPNSDMSNVSSFVVHSNARRHCLIRFVAP